MFYLAQTVPQFPVAEIRYPDNSGSKTLIDPNQIKQYASSDKEVVKSIKLLMMGDYELEHGGGRSYEISSKRLVYELEIPFNSPIAISFGNIAKGTIYRVVDAETGFVFGGSVTYNREDYTSSFPFPVLPVPPSVQQNPQSVPEPPILLGLTSVGMVILLRKRNKRN